MLNKKFMLMAIFIISLLAVSAVSAADDTAIEEMAINDDNLIIYESTLDISSDSDNVLYADSSDEISSGSKNVLYDGSSDDISSDSKENILYAKDNGTFTALQSKINSAMDGDEINLENDYRYDDGFNNQGIYFNKSLTINGNGHKIDALGKSRIFNFTGSNVIFNNISFYNGYAEDGGAIRGIPSAILYCNFVNNTATNQHGGALWTGEEFGQVDYELKIEHSSFTNNSAKYGGAIFTGGSNMLIQDCIFTKNYANSHGSAIYFDVNGISYIYNIAMPGGGNNNTINNCTFNNNPDAIYSEGYYDTIDNSTFNHSSICFEGRYCLINNSNILNDSDVEFEGRSNTINNSIISNDSTVYLRNNLSSIDSCRFVDAEVYFDDEVRGSIVENSYFTNQDSYISLRGSSNLIYNCTFENKSRVSIRSVGNYGDSSWMNVTVDSCNFNSSGLYINQHYNRRSATRYVFISNNYFANNHDVGYGGAIYISNNLGDEDEEVTTDYILIDNNYFVNNSADYGGAIYSEGNANITYSTFKSNSANEGGAILWNSSKGLIKYCKSYTKDPAKGNDLKIIGSVTLIEYPISIDAMDVDKYYGGSDKLIVTLAEYGSPLKNAKLELTLNGKTELLTTDSNGQASYDLNLGIGTYKAYLKYGDYDESATINVKSTIGVDNCSGTYLNSNVSASFLNVDGSPLANAKVSFKVGTKTFTATTDAKGLAKPNIDLGYGTYNVTAINPANNEQRTFRLNINKAKTTTALSVAKANSKLTLTANLSPVAVSGNVVFNVNGTNYTAAISGAKASLSLSNLTVGNYYAIAYYNGNINYNPSNSSKVSFNWTKNDVSPYSIKSNDLSKYYGGSEKYAVTLTKSNSPVSGATVKFTLNGKSYSAKTDSKGQAGIDVNLSAGTYTAIASYDSISVSSKVTVKSTVSAADSKGTYLNSKVSATFLNTAGKALANTKVSFKAGSKTYTATTNSNGVATASVDLGVGTYNVTAINPKNNEQKTSKLTISKAKSSLSVTSSSRNNVLTLTATVSPSAATGNVVFNINNKNYTAKISSGKAVQNVTGLNTGNYTVKATYNGDSNFNSSSATAKAVFKKVIVTKIIYNDMYTGPVPKGAGRIGNYFCVKLVDQNNTPLSGLPMEIGFNGRIYNKTTDSNGDARLQINLGYEGAYTFAIGFLGDDERGAAFEVAKIKVSNSYPKPNKANATSSGYELNTSQSKTKIKTSIDYDNMNTKSVIKVEGRAGDDFVVTLLDANKKPLANKPVKIGFNGVIYDKTTDSSGKAQLKINLLYPNTYTFAICYLGDSKYQASFVVAKIKVSKQTPKLTSSSKTFKSSAKTKSLSATLVSMRGKAISGQKVKFTVNGKTYTGKTNSNGVATVNISLNKKGTYSCTVKFAGMTGVSSKSTKISVKIT